MIRGHIPIKNNFIRARHCKRFTFYIADCAVRKSACCKSILHDGEANKHHDENKPANQRWRHEIVGDPASYSKAGRSDPDNKQEPSRDQHNRPIKAMRSEIEHQDQTNH